MKSKLSIAALSLIGLILLSGCEQTTTTQQPPAAPAVSVAEVVQERLTEWDEFTGRIEAPQNVELRPRVSGYIDFVAFDEGAMVKPGDPLFFIDNRPYKAEVKRLEAELAQATAQNQLAQREYLRAQDLKQQNAVSQELLDSRLAGKQQAHARVESVKAALELARLQLSYTRVTAPIAGRVSNALVTKGNYVHAGQSVLTSLVSTDEVYAYFDTDEQTYLKYSQLAQQGQRPSSRDNQNPVVMGLANDQGYPYQGVIDFVDNQVNQQTGTIRARAVFDNPNGFLIPGLFARIKLVGSASYEGILIDDKAIGTDLSNKFVMVLDENNVAQYRAVELGEKLNGLRIVRSGLSAGEQIIVNGLQRVRPGTPVQPQVVAMTSEQNIVSLRAIQQRIDASNKQSLLAKQPAASKVATSTATQSVGG